MNLIPQLPCMAGVGKHLMPQSQAGFSSEPGLASGEKNKGRWKHTKWFLVDMMQPESCLFAEPGTESESRTPIHRC